MAGNNTGLLERPHVHRSPFEGFGEAAHAPAPNFRTAAATRPSGGSRRSETDMYLRRSHVIVERLRRAVAERTGGV